MATFKETNENLKRSKADDELIIKITYILKVLESHEFKNDKYPILIDLYTTGNAFIKACTNEMKGQTLIDIDKENARQALEESLSIYKEFMQTEVDILIHTYYQSRLN